MKWIFFIGFLFSVGATQAAVNDETGETLKWYTDLDIAHTDAKAEDKAIFGFFTGSDWCGWCKLLQKNVFAKQAFIDWAKENVILLELDFPKRTVLSDAQKIQNRNLQLALGVSGYPTIWLFSSEKDSTGAFSLTKYGKLGYPSGAEKGKEEVMFLENVKRILPPKPPAPPKILTEEEQKIADKVEAKKAKELAKVAKAKKKVKKKADKAKKKALAKAGKMKGKKTKEKEDKKKA